jgi:hypothetical protein
MRKIPTADRYLKSLPTQLKIWSPNSIATYCACPRRYWYRYGEMWDEGSEGEERSVDLAFGDYVHQGHDTYIKALGSGADTERATELAVEHVLQASWGWGGEYCQVWRCDGKVKGAKGRPVRCPNSKQWNPLEEVAEVDVDPEIKYCRKCLQPVTSQVVYFPTDRTKNRHTLIRSVIALCDELSSSSLRPLVLPSGEIGSEYTFLRDLPLRTPDGDGYYKVTGAFDGLSTVGDGQEWALPELKTTRREPNQGYFNQFLPGVQFLTYTWAAAEEFPEKKPRIYLIVLQVGVGFSNVIIRPLRVPPEVLQEWEEEMMSWIKKAEHSAYEHEMGLGLTKAYPRNPTSCHSMPGAPNTPCPFLGICTLSPSDRGPFLRSNFHPRPETPAQGEMN